MSILTLTYIVYRYILYFS